MDFALIAQLLNFLKKLINYYTDDNFRDPVFERKRVFGLDNNIVGVSIDRHKKLKVFGDVKDIYCINTTIPRHKAYGALEASGTECSSYFVIHSNGEIDEHFMPGYRRSDLNIFYIRSDILENPTDEVSMSMLVNTIYEFCTVATYNENKSRISSFEDFMTLFVGVVFFRHMFDMKDGDLSATVYCRKSGIERKTINVMEDICLKNKLQNMGFIDSMAYLASFYKGTYYDDIWNDALKDEFLKSELEKFF